MAFTGLTKYGFTDGEQIGRWGDQFPAFIRIKAGDTLPYIVFREDNPNHPTAGRFGNMFYASRDFIRQTVFGANKSDADLFADKPNNTPDTSEPGSSFVLKDTTTLLFKRPDTGTQTTPVVTNPTNTNPTTTNPTTTTPTTTNPATTVPTSNLTPTTTTTTTTTTNPAAMTPAIKWTIIGVAVVIVAGILYMVVKGSGNQAYGPRPRRYGRRY
jgi:hypothetical protein